MRPGLQSCVNGTCDTVPGDFRMNLDRRFCAGGCDRRLLPALDRSGSLVLEQEPYREAGAIWHRSLAGEMSREISAARVCAWDNSSCRLQRVRSNRTDGREASMPRA
jgi:hypothetical protein